MKYGFIGSGMFVDKEYVIKKLHNMIDVTVDIIVSGHSPNNDYDNVDIWAEDWANEFCWNKPIIHPAKKNVKNKFFLRNVKIARDSDKLVCFINSGQYKSGTWNTISNFVRRVDFNFNNLIIYNQNRQLWRTDELPKWVLRKLKFMESIKSVGGLF